MSTKYNKMNFVYFMQKWMDSVPGQTFLNYAYSWGAAVVILGTLFKLTHLPGANVMLFLGMGTEVFVFFISAFDRPFDKTTIDMTLDNHMADEVIDEVLGIDTPKADAPASQPAVAVQPVQQSVVIGQPAAVAAQPVSQPAEDCQAEASQPVQQPIIAGGTVIIGGGSAAVQSQMTGEGNAVETSADAPQTDAPQIITFQQSVAQQPVTPAPAVTPETAEAMEEATTAYVERLEQLNETLLKVDQLSSRLATDSEEMENLNRTLTGIARVYEMQLKSASQQITTQDSINEQTRIMAEKIAELNSIYTRMIEAMTVNMPKGAM